jgi:NADH:ubiquinone oxidoreductase subunit C
VRFRATSACNCENELKLKRFLTVARIKTISNIFLSSNWMEETFDFYGVDFIDTHN